MTFEHWDVSRCMQEILSWIYLRTAELLSPSISTCTFAQSIEKRFTPPYLPAQRKVGPVKITRPNSCRYSEIPSRRYSKAVRMPLGEAGADAGVCTAVTSHIEHGCYTDTICSVICMLTVPCGNGCSSAKRISTRSCEDNLGQKACGSAGLSVSP